MNKPLVRDLLSSLGIASNMGSNGVLINRNESIVKAARLPLFRNANDRLVRLRAISQMIRSMKWTPVSKEELKFMLELHRQRYTFGQITVLLWAEHGIARRPTTVRDIVRRHSKASK